jgi:hypothetical protein
MNVYDAEDAVHEAMVRAAENANVDDARLGAWLTWVTIRLCVDRHRQINREAEVHTRSARAAAGPATVEDAVCDQAEAKWLAGHSARTFRGARRRCWTCGRRAWTSRRFRSAPDSATRWFGRFWPGPAGRSAPYWRRHWFSPSGCGAAGRKR